MRLYFILICLLVLPASYLKAQPDFTIYLGDDVYTRYDTSTIKITFTKSHPFAESFQYHTLDYEIKTDTGEHATIRSGFILTAKSTDKQTQKGDLLFGSNTDTAHILFSSEVDNTIHGRSALVSISNLFSKKADKHPQADPYQTEDVHQFEGIIQTQKYQSAFFYLFDTRKDKQKIEGWLVIENDTLHLIRSQQIKKLRDGKIKGTSHYFVSGFQLMKGDICIAAVDEINKPATAYLSKDLSVQEKLLITSFFAITAAYDKSFL